MAAACLALLAGMALPRAVIVPLQRAHQLPVEQDFDTFYYAAKAVHQHGRTYLDDADLRRLARQETGDGAIPAVTAPPLAFVPFMPLTYLSLASARVVWHLFSLLTLAGAFVVLHRGLGASSAARTAGFALAAVAFFEPLRHAFDNNQTNLLMLLLVAGAIAVERSRRNDRDAIAGGLLGLAIASKIFPAVVLPLYVARGRWRLVAWTAVAIVVLTVVGLPLTGWQDYVRYPEHLRGSYYFRSGADVAWNLSLKRSWLLAVEAWIAPPLAGLVKPVIALPLVWVLVRVWKERSAPLVLFQLRLWQACLLMPTVMASYWEYHLVFALGPMLWIVDDAARGRASLSNGAIAAAAIAFVAACVPTFSLLPHSLGGVSLLAWLRWTTTIVLFLVLERMAARLAITGEPR